MRVHTATRNLAVGPAGASPSSRGAIPPPKGRKGAVSFWVFFTMGLFVAIFALVVDASSLWQARIDLLTASDAATLAAGAELIDDDMLIGDAARIQAVMRRARAAAVAYGLANPVLGEPLLLDANEENRPGGDVEFGRLDGPDSRGFVNLPLDELYPAQDSLLPPVNAVRVYAQRTRARGNPGGMRLGRLLGTSHADVTARSTVYLDRDVIGFRITDQQALPIAPFALWSDRLALAGLYPEDLDLPQFGRALESWEAHTVLPAIDPALGLDGDHWHFDKEAGRFLPASDRGVGPDGLHEMEVLVPVGAPAGKDAPRLANARLLKFAPPTVEWPVYWENFARQVENGLTAADLAEFGGQLLLRGDNRKGLRLSLPSRSALPREEEEVEAIMAALVKLRDSAEARIWPLYGHVTEGDDGEGVADVCGFVAARLAYVELAWLPLDPQQPQGPAKAYVRLILQPAMMSVPYAITDDARAREMPWLRNPYLAKVRLVPP